MSVARWGLAVLVIITSGLLSGATGTSATAQQVTAPQKVCKVVRDESAGSYRGRVKVRRECYVAPGKPGDNVTGGGYVPQEGDVEYRVHPIPAIPCIGPGTKAEGYAGYRFIFREGKWVGDGCVCIAKSDLNPKKAASPPKRLVQEALAEVDFAKLGIRAYPPGWRTLVNIPTYFEAEWSPKGLAPGEISAPQAVLGWKVQFKLKAEYRFTFGKGETAVTSWTGGYPDGFEDVEYTYLKRGQRAVSVQARVTPMWRVVGQRWQRLDAPFTIKSQTKTLAVLEAHPRLGGNTN